MTSPKYPPSRPLENKPERPALKTSSSLNTNEYDLNQINNNLDERFVKSSSLIESIFDSKAPSYLCDFSEETFIDDLNLAQQTYESAEEQREFEVTKYISPFKNGYIYTISRANTILTTTTVDPDTKDIFFGNNQKLENINSTSGLANNGCSKRSKIKRIEIGVEKVNTAKDSLLPYRFTTTNEYETASMSHVSSMTTFSDVLFDDNNNNRLITDENISLSNGNLNQIKEILMLPNSYERLLSRNQNHKRLHNF